MDADRPAPSALERWLERDRWWIAVSLALIAVLAWIYLLVMARQMARGDMTLLGFGDMPGMVGSTMATMPMPWTGRTFVLTALMWWVMMIGMMIPSAAPMVLLFGAVERRRLPVQNPAVRVAVFTAAYLVVWSAFSVLAASAQWGLTELALLSPMELTATPRIGAAFVALAGAYQLTPLKNVCLRRCRSPADFLSARWRGGTAGALRMGVEHGVYCVGCCWLLMGLLFFGGVMSLLWVAAIAALVLLEKLMPRGEWLARASGVALLLLAGCLLL